jgi:hypothetical protein
LRERGGVDPEPAGASAITRLVVLSLATGAACLAAGHVSGQDMEPRAYSPNPMGANFVVLSGGNSTGSVLLDPSLPITDVHASIDTLALSYNRTFGVFGRAASAALAAPYAWGTIEGQVEESFHSIWRSGLGDWKLRLAVNLVGGPALTRPEFANRRPTTSLGISLIVVAPTGQYDPSKLINVGANRWAFKPELGLSHPVGHWAFEGYLGLWLYTTNHEFFGGSVRAQDPILTLQAHVAFTFKPRLWLAGDATFYTGGSTTVDGVANSDHQSNSRVGMTLAVPVWRQFSVKGAWTTGAITRIGVAFTTYTLAAQYSWF